MKNFHWRRAQAHSSPLYKTRFNKALLFPQVFFSLIVTVLLWRTHTNFKSSENQINLLLLKYCK